MELGDRAVALVVQAKAGEGELALPSGCSPGFHAALEIPSGWLAAVSHRLSHCRGFAEGDAGSPGGHVRVGADDAPNTNRAAHELGVAEGGVETAEHRLRRAAEDVQV